MRTKRTCRFSSSTTHLLCAILSFNFLSSYPTLFPILSVLILSASPLNHSYVLLQMKHPVKHGRTDGEPLLVHALRASSKAAQLEIDWWASQALSLVLIRFEDSHSDVRKSLSFVAGLQCILSPTHCFFSSPRTQFAGQVRSAARPYDSRFHFSAERTISLWHERPMGPQIAFSAFWHSLNPSNPTGIELGSQDRVIRGRV